MDINQALIIEESRDFLIFLQLFFPVSISGTSNCSWFDQSKIGEQGSSGFSEDHYGFFWIFFNGNLHQKGFLNTIELYRKAKKRKKKGQPQKQQLPVTEKKTTKTETHTRKAADKRMLVEQAKQKNAQEIGQKRTKLGERHFLQLGRMESMEFP